MSDHSEEVRGVIIGGEYWKWQLWYDGRPQSPRLPADTEAEAQAAGKAEYESIKAECGQAFTIIHPLKDAWTIRTWGP